MSETHSTSGAGISGKKIINVKIAYEDEVKRIRGTKAIEEHGLGTLVVYDGLSVVARFFSGVERWWTEEE